MQLELENFKSSTCNKCNSFELNIVELNQVIKKNVKG